MTSIDPTYTLGRLAADRDRVLATLRSERLTERNSMLPHPSVPLRIGLVTAAGSAAYADFLHELESSGFAFDVVHIDARVQGSESERSLVDAIGTISSHGVDVVAVVRGGGAKTDLASFDSEAVARAIATCALPVHTGIGHEVDESISDLVAQRAHKTPTACAAALVDSVQAFLRRVEQAADELPRAALHRLDVATTMLDTHQRSLGSRITRVLGRERERLDARAITVRAHDPRRTLTRGWTITRNNAGDIVRSIDELSRGDEVTVQFADGAVGAVVGDTHTERTDHD